MFGRGGGTWQAGSGNTWGDDATVGIANFKGWITNLKYRFKLSPAYVAVAPALAWTGTPAHRAPTALLRRRAATSMAKACVNVADLLLVLASFDRNADGDTNGDGVTNCPTCSKS